MEAALRSLFSFPLLAKELTERAARPRTYWIRAVLAVLLYSAFWFTFAKRFTSAAVSPISLLGTGRSMFEGIVGMLFGAIYLLVPAMMCGVVTQEKERDSLVLILLTNIRPWQIVFQKYFGGLIPALNFLLLGMPLAAVAFAYGGVTTFDLVKTLGILVFAVFQIGAIALWASCWCRTTVAAFLTTYAIAAVLVLAPVLLEMVDHGMMIRRLLGSYTRPWLIYQHIPPAAALGSWGSAKAYFGIPNVAVPFIHIGGSTLIFLLAAIWHLPRRAFTPARNWLRTIFAAVDRWMQRANRLVGSVRLGRKSADLPDRHPLVWREKRTRALARPEHLVRLLLLIMVPVGFIAFQIIAGRDHTGLSFMAAVVGVLAVLTLSTTAANSIVGERVNQTYELLLTTPMSAESILRQKAIALRPLALVGAIPLLSIVILRICMSVSERNNWSVQYLSIAALILAVNLPLVAWISIWAGLWCKTRIRAISLALAIIVGWCVLPLFALFVADAEPEPRYEWSRQYSERIPRPEAFPTRYLFLLSPLFMPAANEVGHVDDMEPKAPWIPVVVNFTFYGCILFGLRRHCLRNADIYLRR